MPFIPPRFGPKTCLQPCPCREQTATSLAPFNGSAPGGPGCLIEGDTIEEALVNINEAIIGCLKSKLLVAGEKIKIPAFSQRLDISLEATESYA